MPIEKHGAALTTADVVQGWLDYLPYARVYTAERVAYANLLRAVPADRAAEVRNPYREWIGALIRGDVFGWVHPGRPVAAVRLAYRDASLSHRGNGVYGELWSAALTASALVGQSVDAVLDRASVVVPAGSRLAEAIELVRQLHRSGLDFDRALLRIQQHCGHYDWVHTVNNAALITAGLLWAEGDFWPESVAPFRAAGTPTRTAPPSVRYWADFMALPPCRVTLPSRCMTVRGRRFLASITPASATSPLAPVRLPSVSPRRPPALRSPRPTISAETPRVAVGFRRNGGFRARRAAPRMRAHAPACAGHGHAPPRRYCTSW